MQRLLERGTPTSGGGGSYAKTPLHARPQLWCVVLLLVATLYFIVVVMPSMSTMADDEFGQRSSERLPTNRVSLLRNLAKTSASNAGERSRSPHFDSVTPLASPSDASQLVLANSIRAPPPPDSSSSDAHDGAGSAAVVSVPMLPPWGYNKERNVPRWEALWRSIAHDGKKAFTLVDYGSDQGYFSISVAKFFPEAFVVGLEMGGVGGEIWNKGRKAMDVLSIQEEHLRKEKVSNVMICQTTMQPLHFFMLRERHARSDYQLMLSVFHWFDLKTRAEFEDAVIALFSNARTTFIELPTIGDHSDLIRKQVGYKNFATWYDGRTDVKQILLDAAEAKGARIVVTKVLESPWVKWTRVVYRVDFVAQGESRDKGENSLAAFQCEARREIYECRARQQFSSCPVLR